MDNIPEHIAYLLYLSLHGSLSPEQKNDLEVWAASNPANKALREKAEDRVLLLKELQLFREADAGKSHAWQKLDQQLGLSDTGATQPKSVRIYQRWPWWAAACIIVIFGCIIQYFNYNRQETVPVNKIAVTIPAGKLGAVVTLSDGRQMLLDSLKNGPVALQNGVKANVINGSLVYSDTNGNLVYNTISTPKGRHYQLILSDGTAVWLNASSSIRFPTRFEGDQRNVEITGEVYFEVAKNKHKAFKVITPKNLEVVVLGTHFNINSYANEESVRATLLEGSILLNYAGQHQHVKPGQEGSVRNVQQKGTKDLIQIASGVDTEKTIAWKNGLFNFNGLGIDEIMKQLERWYAIDVSFEGKVPDTRFFGEISRNEPLQNVLAALEAANIHFRFEGERRLIVLAK